MEKGVSYRRADILERKANEILDKAKEKGFYNFDSATPIDLISERIFRLRIDFVDLNKDFEGALGALDLKNRVIWIDESLNHTDPDNDYNLTTEARCNYTIAHEGGHYVFHRPQYRKAENIALFHDSSEPRTKALETQANMFASYLLMPKVVMVKKWDEIDHNCPAWKAIDDMRKFFKVSKETMIYRLKSLGLLDPSY